ncbi:MAG: hypothetical protein CL908_11440 [Deltaproteobacteria bacterium]|jgi:hypothetical protein|nr:hypothetical protein [Deltaproteobacteria bacterium]
MSQKNRSLGTDGALPVWAGLSEPESHTEHQAALDATVFRCAGDAYELVLELEAGELRVRPTRGEQ